MEFHSALSILVSAMCSSGYVQTAVSCPGKDPFSTAVDATCQIIDLLANTYGRGVGRIPDKRPCPAGLRDDGVSCWSDAHIYGKGCCWGCCNQCRSGYHDDGCTCRKTDVGIKVTLFERQYCRDDEDKYGALCYPKCREGWVAAGCCVCKRIMSV